MLGFHKKYSFILISSILSGLFLLTSFVYAQVSVQAPPAVNLSTGVQFDYLVSWRAINYVPANYQGKILPSRNSEIEVSVDVLSQGKFIDISNQNIVWYLNNNLLRSGTGLKAIRFTASQDRDQVVEMDIPNYKDSKNTAANVGMLITIPSSSPKVIINAPYPNKTITIGQNLLQAVPFFFSVADITGLRFNWEIDGQKAAGQPGNADILNLSTETQGSPAPGANISVKAFVQNIADEMELGSKYINLDIR